MVCSALGRVLSVLFGAVVCVLTEDGGCIATYIIVATVMVIIPVNLLTGGSCIR